MNAKHVMIIAEAGVNHNGNIENAFRLVDAAAYAGVDYIKFQTFKAEMLVSGSAKKADYQIQNTRNAEETQLQMLQKLELSQETHAECKFTDQELDNALDLATRRGGTGIGLIKDAEEFLYC